MDPERSLESSLQARLTPSQRAAIDASDDRLCVLAGAGAGKTRVLTLRVARLIDEGVDPSHVLVVTFSRKAASELRTRLWRLGIEGVRAGTFHRTALELIEIHRAEQGLGPPRLLTDRRRLLARLLEEGLRRPPSSAAPLDTEISWAKARGIDPAGYELAAERARRRTSLRPHQVAELYGAYEVDKARQGLLDFDDLIIDAVRLLADERFAAAIHWRTRHVLVDEFQDVNAMQFALVERLVTPSTTFFCVGDPNQSIYAFNGAEPDLLRGLSSAMPTLTTLVLDDNHRSSPEIVLAASAVLPEQDRRPSRSSLPPGAVPELVELETDVDEAAFVAKRIRAVLADGSPARSIAVLARTNAQLAMLEAAITDVGVPAAKLAPDLARASDVTTSDEPRAPRHDASSTNLDAVALGTFHRSKGLEWPHVFVIGASEGLIPHAAATSPAAIDEERRLLYVALTRAETTLTVTWARRRDGEEPTRAVPRQRSSLLGPFARSIEQLQAERRPTSAERATTTIAALRRQLAEQGTETPR